MTAPAVCFKQGSRGQVAARADVFMREFGPVGGKCVPSTQTASWAIRVGQVVVAVGAVNVVDRDAFLSTAAVAPSWRGRGLQRRLIQLRVRFAQREGCNRAWTYVARGNAASLLNLVREGFLVVGTIEDAGADGGGWVYLERKL